MNQPEKLLYEIMQLISNDKRIYPLVPEYETVKKIIELCRPTSKEWPEKQLLQPVLEIGFDTSHDQKFREGWNACHDAFMAVIGKKEETHKHWIDGSITGKCNCQPSPCEHEWQMSSSQIFCKKCGIHNSNTMPKQPQTDEVEELAKLFPTSIPFYKCKVYAQHILDAGYRKGTL